MMCDLMKLTTLADVNLTYDAASTLLVKYSQQYQYPILKMAMVTLMAVRV